MSNIKRQLQRLQGVAPVAALVIPAGFTGFLILNYSVDVPLWDEWVGVTFLYKLNAGTLSFADLFRQQDVYRQFFPNLIFVIIGRLTKFDVRYHMALSLLFGCLVSLNIYRLSSLTLNRASDRLWAYVAANLIIFSPAQLENWLQGQQLIFFFPIACLSTCLVIATASRLRFATKCIACAALSLVSTFSSANGILCWLLVLPVLWAWSDVELRLKRRLAIVWIAAIGLSAIVYMYGYQPVAHNTNAVHVFTHPIEAITFFLRVIGSPLTFFRFFLAAEIGFGIVIIFIWTCVRFARSLNDRTKTRRSLVWLVIGAYSLLTALLITFGRLGFGIDQALRSRYTTFTLYLPLALVYLLALEIPKRLGDSRFIRTAFLRRLPIAAIAIIVVHAPIYLLAVRSAPASRRNLLQVKTCILLANVTDDQCLIYKGHFPADWYRQMANQAQSLGLLRPPLITTRNVQDLALPDISVSETDNSFVEVVPTTNHEYVASGRAISPGTVQPPDAVLLAYDDDKGGHIIFAAAFPKTERALRDILRGRGMDVSWRGTFDLRKLPVGRLRLTAWGFDAETVKTYRLNGTHTIENADSRNVQQQ